MSSRASVNGAAELIPTGLDYIRNEEESEDLAHVFHCRLVILTRTKEPEQCFYIPSPIRMT